MTKPKYKIIVTYYIGIKPFYKKEKQEKEFYDGLTKTIFKKESKAKKYFNYAMEGKMLRDKENTMRKGNEIFEYSKGYTSKELYENFKKGLDEAQEKKQKGISITYEIIKGGDN